MALVLDKPVRLDRFGYNLDMSEETAGSRDDLFARALPSAGLVDYQSGSVVSRTILKKSTGNVTLFAFDAGEGLSEHTAPFDALVFILDGSAEITIAGEALTASAGEFVIMPADRPHSLRANERFKMALVMIRS